MHVAHQPRRHDRRREPVRLFRAVPPPTEQEVYNEALDRQAHGMNSVALLTIIGFVGTLTLIQLYAWLTGAAGIGVMLGWQ